MGDGVQGASKGRQMGYRVRAMRVFRLLPGVARRGCAATRPVGRSLTHLVCVGVLTWCAAGGAAPSRAGAPSAGDAGPAALAARSTARSTATDTLARVRAEGVLRLGVRRASEPFSFRDGRGGFKGYSVELCGAIADTIAALPGMPPLRVEFVEVNSANRIPRLLMGEIDIECGSTSITDARREHVAFSRPIFVVGIGAAVTDPCLTRLLHVAARPELAELGIALTAGTTAVKAVRVLEERHGVRFTRHLTADHDESFRLLLAGRVAAFVHDDVLLANLIGRANRGEAGRGEAGRGEAGNEAPGGGPAGECHLASSGGGSPPSRSAGPRVPRLIDVDVPDEPYGLMFRRADTAFCELVDRVLSDWMRGPSFEALHGRWFQGSMSAANRRTFGQPGGECRGPAPAVTGGTR